MIISACKNIITVLLLDQNNKVYRSFADFVLKFQKQIKHVRMFFEIFHILVFSTVIDR